ncbi:hypothetical protein [Brachyspira hampsonii]|uniref:Uncharacterized protein n=1 Tax=Brachyspira hampsonii 30446 TaxID=1289135 RepID=A0A2U4EUC1_9SPIR|nr:hypothetical protein [Brachyspira hampsonii]EKV56125.1 hypothetical protein A966_12221 [Brachyspira hampsonii 30446]MBW5388901.1 hypothetical protein [Brachyspira hampsonii]MBW5395239.1 hypothetical protein [Brachyspira hampsonii]OEJ18035.1 hypothetical protein A9495_06400 [Brachyspira hampsonii]PTY40162.1 hypothetical protein DQ06_06100 [Brachyspira hampsonii bv. II]
MRRIIPTIITIIAVSIITYLLISKDRPYEQSYTIGNDAVSSLNKVTGLKVHPKIDNIEEGEIKILNFYNVDDVISYSVKYANYLWKNEGYYITTNYYFGKKPDGKIELAKNSSEDGRVIRINVECNTNNSFTVILSLLNGSLIMRNTNEISSNEVNTND